MLMQRASRSLLRRPLSWPIRELKVPASELRAGSILTGSSVGQQPDKLLAVEDFTKGKAGKGGAYLQIKLREFGGSASGFSHRFNVDDRVEVIELDPPQRLMHLYEDDGTLYLMDAETGEQSEVPTSLLGDGQAAWLQDGMELSVRSYQGQPLSVRLPEHVTVEVAEAAASNKQGKSGDAHKTVTLANGARLRVPHFVQAGQRIVVSTLDGGSYVGKAEVES